LYFWRKRLRENIDDSKHVFHEMLYSKVKKVSWIGFHGSFLRERQIFTTLNTFEHVERSERKRGEERKKGSISPTSLRAALMCADPNSEKRQLSLSVFLRFFWSACTKAVRKILVKLTQGRISIIWRKKENHYCFRWSYGRSGSAPEEGGEDRLNRELCQGTVYCLLWLARKSKKKDEKKACHTEKGRSVLVSKLLNKKDWHTHTHFFSLNHTHPLTLTQYFPLF